MARVLRIGALMAFIASGLVVASATPAVAAPSWSIVASPSPAGPTHGELLGTTCTSATNCLAVGHTGFLTLAERWNGNSWSEVATPDADWTFGASETYLAGVACAGASTCFAVGLGVDGAGWRPLIQRWNGSSWSSVAAPGSGTSVALNAVACASASMCHAVGNNDTTLYAARWNGSSWSKEAIPNEAGGTLSGIKCTSAKSCIAVGSYAGGSKTLVEHWNGTKWTVAASPNPAGAAASSFAGVGCPALTACFAVGTYTTKTHQQRTLVERWNGTKWSIVASPNPSAHPALASVACRSTSSCTAVGTRGTFTLVEHWNGTKWTVVGSPNPSGATGGVLHAVSCPSATVCLGTGSGTVTGSPNPRVFTERGNGSVWKVQASPVGASVSPLGGVACATSTLCFAGGTSEPTSPTTARAFLQQWNGTTWTAATLPLPAGATASELTHLACGSPTFCVAVGDATIGSQKTLIEQWNGSTWSVAPVAVAGSLAGVSCADASHCAAVGTSGGQTLVEQWNGSTWTTASGAVSGSLSSVSCADTSDCMAVGIINLPNSPVLRWNGSTWTAINGVAPGGDDPHEITPSGVACAAANDCVFVGHYRDLTEYPSSYGGHWDGISWSSVGVPTAGFGGFAEDVACASGTDCTAVGNYFPNHGGPLTEIQHWNGSSWGIVTSPNPPALSPPGTSLEGVTCAGASNCFAVGWWTDHASTRTLIERFA